VCSGSWDSKIKLWDLEGQNIEMTTLNAHKAAVLCMAWEQEMLISGSYDKTISLWDLRGGNSVGRLKNHTKPVLCLSVDDRFIISGSEDQTLSVYDRRAAKVYKTIKVKSLPLRPEIINIPLVSRDVFTRGCIVWLLHWY